MAYYFSEICPPPSLGKASGRALKEIKHDRYLQTTLLVIVERLRKGPEWNSIVSTVRRHLRWRE